MASFDRAKLPVIHSATEIEFSLVKFALFLVERYFKEGEQKLTRSKRNFEK